MSRPNNHASQTVYTLIMPPLIIRLPALPLTKSLRRAPKGGIRHDATGKQYAGGTFIPAALWESERTAAKDGLATLLTETADALQFLRLSYQQNAALAAHPDIAHQYKIPIIPLSTVEARLKTTIRNGYRDAFLLGKRAAGNLTGITPDEAKALLKVRKDEYNFLRQFLSAMRGGGGVMDYGQRTEMYAMAVREAYWLGWVLSNLASTRTITWKRGETSDSCVDCCRFEAHGPYTAAEFWHDVASKGYLPQAGKLKCLGRHCRCFLTDDAGVPAQKEG